MSMASSTFGFLQPDWPDLLAEARRAEAAAHADTRTACFYARRTLELAVAWLYRAEGGRGGCLRMPYKADLSAFFFEPGFQQLVGPAVHTKMDVIRRLGNKAVHDVHPVSDQPAATLQFRTDLLPRLTAIETANEQAASRAAQAAAQEALAKQALALAGVGQHARAPAARSGWHRWQHRTRPRAAHQPGRFHPLTGRA